ncbi:MAG: hypothetical protein Q7S40_11600 [Opitutaceae bacterium]|nr:hypothetical protein [Opitutaceae bacterium]
MKAETEVAETGRGFGWAYFLPWSRLVAVLICFMCGSAASAQTSFTTRHDRPGGNFLWAIASGPAGLVTVGDGGTILTSTNGTTWTRRNSGVTDWLVGVAYGGGRYVAVGDKGRVLSSTDGATWLSVPQSATTARLNNVLHAAGMFVAVGEGGAIVTSPDGRVWTARASGVTGWLRAITYVNAVITKNNFPGLGGVVSSSSSTNYPAEFLVAGQGGIILESADGNTWSSIADEYWTRGAEYPVRLPTNDLEAIVMIGSSAFAAVGQDGALVFDKIYIQYGGNPYLQPLAIVNRVVSSYRIGQTTARLRGLVQGANALFATGENGTIMMAPGVNGPWTSPPSGTTANLVSGLCVGNSLYVVGQNETILESTPLYNSRLANISTRGLVGTGGNVMISGFVITGTAKKSLLVRAAGPALTAFSVPGTLAAPVLTVLDGAGRPLASNAGWGDAANSGAVAAAATQVGAFAFAAGSADAALLVTLDPSSYTVQVAGLSSGTGVALVEAYDTDGPASDASRAINISTRGFVGTGGDALIAGFNISGAASRRVLIRAVGPTLGAFGVDGTLTEPVLEVYRGSTVTASARGPWSQQANADEIRGAAFRSGAFALAEDSKDAALIVALFPGSWTVKVTGVGNATGVALVEVYDLP